MNEMVERVARIICIADVGDPDILLGGDDQNFLWHEYKRTAREVIEAMMEPSARMAGEGDALFHMAKPPTAPAVWQAMLKAALEEDND